MNKVQALINSGSKINAMTLAQILKLGLKICHTNIRAYKIDDSILKIFEIVITSFQTKDKLKKAYFFLKNLFIS